MDPTASGDTAAHLTWLWPDAACLIALTQPLTANTWSVLRRDPGSMLLLFGHGADTRQRPDGPLLTAARAGSLYGLRTALLALETGGGGWADWRRPDILPVYRTALAVAHFSQLIAGFTHRCEPETAWVAGLLAPLGWLAVAAVAPESAAECLHDARAAAHPLDVQESHWGRDHAEIARRLGRRWLLPDWLRIPVGHLGLPVAMAVELGADQKLFATIQLAALLAEQYEAPLGLVSGVDRGESLSILGLGEQDLDAICGRFEQADLSDLLAEERQDPRTLPFLPRVLRTAVEQAHRRTEVNRCLEHDVDRLHRLLVAQRITEEERVRSEKLVALAEFAAGASHEINNPLAVISGQCQYLLQSEREEKHQQALHSIIRQVQRIHGLLTDVMQFARPSRPNRQSLSMWPVLERVADEMRLLASERGITLECVGSEHSVLVSADSKQIQTALACLVRNAIQAAGDGGRVRVALEPADDAIAVAVEDSGPTPTLLLSRQMFDPFYSGRTAGRGRGLGLPTAWRLARENGGDVRFDPKRGGPTRFVLTLPKLAAAATADRLSA